MSLDNFGVKVKSKSSKHDKKTSKSKKISKKSTNLKQKSTKKKTNKKETSSTVTQTRKKYYLKCTAKCGYKRTLRKKELTESDYICEKCGKMMKLYKKE
ncbi:MAG: hypothetical protein K9W44_04505 [Candidatus Lokiarchaeota archaeon]|nr:hypothetical protein [Candidatus Harpocratesius repetitus]